MTGQELLTFLNSLTEEQLAQPIHHSWLFCISTSSGMRLSVEEVTSCGVDEDKRVVIG